MSEHRKKATQPPARGGCVGAGTTVLAVSGVWVLVEELAPGDEILSYSVDSQSVETDYIDDIWEAGVQRVLGISSSTGQTLLCTRNHNFCSQEGWGEIGRLGEGTPIGYLDGGQVLYTTISIEDLDESIATYDLSTRRHRNYFANGYLVRSSVRF